MPDQPKTAADVQAIVEENDIRFVRLLLVGFCCVTGEPYRRAERRLPSPVVDRCGAGRGACAGVPRSVRCGARCVASER